MARLLAPLLVVFAFVSACGGSTSAGPGPASTPASTPSATSTEPATTRTGRSEGEKRAKKAKPLPGLPGYTAGFLSWPKLNRKPIPPRDADAHLGTKNVFVSRPARADRRFPNGTLVVKEAVRPGKDFVGLVAVMRKVRGFDPDHRDWMFVEYTRESASAPFTETASGRVCWSCHMGAADSDYVWTVHLGLANE
jgi:Cytochrome P460